MSASGMLIDGAVFQRLCRARDFAAANFHRPVTVGMLANAASLSPWHFHRLFTDAFRQTPHAFLSALRLEQAKRLLASGNISVTDVYLETGFSSLGSFSSWFRAGAGLSPSRYRREIHRVFGTAAAWRFTFIPTCYLAAFRGPE